MSKTETIRHYFEEQFKKGQTIDNEYLISRNEFEASRRSYPQLVREAYDLYFEEVECGDWGSVRFYMMPVAEEDVFIIHTTTDGDDGWLELIALDGSPLGLGKTYLDEIKWGGLEIRNKL